jgi:phosphate:Na+ symporter
MNHWGMIIVFIGLSTLFALYQEMQVVLGGVALFFLGMFLLESGMKSFAGGALEGFLKKATNTTLKAIFTGFLTTAFVQSSSLVSLIAISFLSAGLISLSAGIGIVFGANLGTTTTSWLVALFGLKLKISSYALAMAAFGTLFSLSKSNTLKGIANILLGLALLLLAIGFMKEGFESIKETIDLTQYAMGGFRGLFLFVFIGIFATIVMQSSSATMALVLTALVTQQITYENALALSIGANIGTTVTAILGSLTSNSAGKKLAGAHLIFNFTTGLIAIIFLPYFMTGVEFIANYFSLHDAILKLAIFHTLFNLVGVVFMSPLIGTLVHFLNRFLKPKTHTTMQPQFLLDELLTDPTASTIALKSEVKHLFDCNYSPPSKIIFPLTTSLRASNSFIFLLRAVSTIDLKLE